MSWPRPRRIWLVGVLGAVTAAACGQVGTQVRLPPGLDAHQAELAIPFAEVQSINPQVSAAAPSVESTSIGFESPSAPGTFGPTRWTIDSATSGQPFPGASVEGLLTFRGSPTRSFYGAGPVPQSPVVRWVYPPTGGLCGTSFEGSVGAVWCGTGWTGQPAIWRGQGRWNGRWVTAFGAYDGAVHVLDADTGQPLLPAFQTGDLIKGSVTIDPDGYPLLYVGSRDNYLRIIALDRAEPTELWRLSANDVGPVLWNDDWDGSPLVLGDLLLEGGENSRFHVIKLNRRIGSDGKVSVAPRMVFDAAGWDEELLAEVGTNVSIESSVAVSGSVAYFANSGGLVQGWDLAAIGAGVRGAPARTFRFWMGDDTDATVVVDDEGYLYVAAEYERGTPRAEKIGQLAKLDPRRPDQPLVWSVPLRAGGVPAGIWATPALHRDLIIVATHAGEIIGVDRSNGSPRWRLQLPGPTWGSPVVVDDVLIQGDCAGVLHGYDVADTLSPPRPLWSVTLGGCIESTPAVFGGHIVVGTRSGQVFGLGEAR